MNSYFIHDTETNKCAGTYLSTSKRNAMQQFTERQFKRLCQQYGSRELTRYEPLNVSEAIEAQILFVGKD